MMRPRQLALVLLLLTLPACAQLCGFIELHANENTGVRWHRSGNVTDANVEEPLPEDLEAYLPQLKKCNALLDTLAAGDLEAIETDLATHASRRGTSFSALFESVVARAGPLKGYKPMQWWFVLGEAPEGFRLVKIVQHEKVTLEYHFVFPDEARADVAAIDIVSARPESLRGADLELAPGWDEIDL